jgi:hypothetical protein
MDEKQKIRLRRTIRFLYDIQELRISTSNRSSSNTADLEKEDLAFLVAQSERLKAIERDLEKEVGRYLKGVPLWDTWLKNQRGVANKLGGVILSSFDIERASTVSKMWRYAGLAVGPDGKAEARQKGVKLSYNPWLKGKMTKILGECLLRSNSPYRQFYDNYKTRKENTRVDVCMGCKGTGTINLKSESTGGTTKKQKKAVTCENCKGTGGPAPWGSSKKHRHNAAMRYMCKMFLQQLWEQWRKIEDLPIRPPYAEEYLNRVHNPLTDATESV